MPIRALSDLPKHAYFSSEIKGRVVMFSRLGRKLKVVAIVIAVLGCGLSIFIGFYLMTKSNEVNIVGVIIFMGGTISSCLSAWAFYALGAILDNTDSLWDLTYQNNGILTGISQKVNRFSHQMDEIYKNLED